MSRVFNVILLKSFDMTEGEVFSGVISVDIGSPEMDFDVHLGNASYFAVAMSKAFDAYYDQCDMAEKAHGRETNPEKIISVVMTEIV